MWFSVKVMLVDFTSTNPLLQACCKNVEVISRADHARKIASSVFVLFIKRMKKFVINISRYF